jgi:hypothetical protein
MSRAPHTLALVTQSTGALAKWHIVENTSGVVELVDIQPTAHSSVCIWSIRDGAPDWPNEPDTLQIELVSRLPWLEERLSREFGDTFANEMGKTISVFLHRLVPDGRKYGSGFPVVSVAQSRHLSVQELAELVLARGMPFLRRVASEEGLLDADFLPPTLLDPVNWAVRRAIVLTAGGHETSCSSALATLAPKVERDLKAKYTAIAAVSKAIDPEERVRAGIARLNHAIQHFASSDA